MDSEWVGGVIGDGGGEGRTRLSRREESSGAGGKKAAVREAGEGKRRSKWDDRQRERGGRAVLEE